MSNLDKLKELAKAADREIDWHLLPSDLATDDYCSELLDYIAAISPCAVLNMIERLEAAEARALAAEESLRIKQNHIRLRDAYIEELEERTEDLECDRDALKAQLDALAKGGS